MDCGDKKGFHLLINPLLDPIRKVEKEIASASHPNQQTKKNRNNSCVCGVKSRKFTAEEETGTRQKNPEKSLIFSSFHHIFFIILLSHSQKVWIFRRMFYFSLPFDGKLKNLDPDCLIANNFWCAFNEIYAISNRLDWLIFFFFDTI
jgi:hypothetical protein